MAKFSGVQELFHSMRGIAPATAEMIEEELTKAAAAMVARAKQLVHSRSGRLAASIRKDVERKADGNLRIVVTAGDKNSPEATWLEFGHRVAVGFANLHQDTAAAFEARRAAYAPAHPFFFPAYHQTVVPMKRRLPARIGVAIDAAARNG
jgi:HK97 gp10 family phage protein